MRSVLQQAADLSAASIFKRCIVTSERCIHAEAALPDRTCVLRLGQGSEGPYTRGELSVSGKTRKLNHYDFCKRSFPQQEGSKQQVMRAIRSLFFLKFAVYHCPGLFLMQQKIVVNPVTYFEAATPADRTLGATEQAEARHANILLGEIMEVNCRAQATCQCALQ